MQDQRYELIFGDDIFGKSLAPGNVVDCTYVMSSGAEGNGIRGFSFAGNLIDNDGAVITEGISPIETIAPSVFGEDIESIDSVKKYSTKVYSAQNRAVTAADYEAYCSYNLSRSRNCICIWWRNFRSTSVWKSFYSNQTKVQSIHD